MDLAQSYACAHAHTPTTTRVRAHTRGTPTSTNLRYLSHHISLEPGLSLKCWAVHRESHREKGNSPSPVCEQELNIGSCQRLPEQGGDPHTAAHNANMQGHTNLVNANKKASGCCRTDWCSWCKQQSVHEIKQLRDWARSVYQCSRCLQRTLPCRHEGCNAFSRGFLLPGPLSMLIPWDESFCLKCQGLVLDYDSGQPTQVSLQCVCKAMKENISHSCPPSDVWTFRKKKAGAHGASKKRHTSCGAFCPCPFATFISVRIATKSPLAARDVLRDSPDRTWIGVTSSARSARALWRAGELSQPLTAERASGDGVPRACVTACMISSSCASFDLPSTAVQTVMN